MNYLHANLQVKRGNFRVNAEFNLPSNGITALFGPSGCGKSTLLRAIAGLQHADEQHHGMLRFVSKQHNHTWLMLNQPTVPAWQRKVGFVFQQPALFPHLNVAKNLAFAWQRVATEERTQHSMFSPQSVAQLCGITAFLERMPEQLSGGQQQRVAIARALVSCPQVLLLDEPLANLDYSAKVEFIALLKRIHQVVQIPMLYVSHQLDEVVQLADYLLLMEQGELVANGNIAEVLQSDKGFASCSGENIIHGIVSAEQAPETGLLAIHVAGHVVSFPHPRLSARNSGNEQTDNITGSYLHAEKDLASTCVGNQAYDEFATGSRCRIHVRARELSITKDRHVASSIRNVIPVTILSLNAAEHPAEQRIRIAIKADVNDGAEEQVVSAVITKSSAERLQLAEQMQVYLQIKAVALSY